jgi:hypothetical protein
LGGVFAVATLAALLIAGWVADFWAFGFLAVAPEAVAFAAVLAGVFCFACCFGAAGLARAFAAALTLGCGCLCAGGAVLRTEAAAATDAFMSTPVSPFLNGRLREDKP